MTTICRRLVFANHAMKHCKLFTLAFLSGLVGSGFGALAAPKWEPITRNDQGLFYIDPQSITLEDGHQKVWGALDYKKPQLTGDGKPYLSIQTQVQINCKQKKARVLHMTYFSGPMLTGQTVYRQGMLHEWLDIDPTSPIQKIARRIC